MVRDPQYYRVEFTALELVSLISAASEIMDHEDAIEQKFLDQPERRKAAKRAYRKLIWARNIRNS